MASPSFSDLRRRIRARTRSIACLALVAVALAIEASGCATVRPEDKEYLAQPSMTFGGEGAVATQEEHVFSNREGSEGGGSATGGGCGCN